MAFWPSGRAIPASVASGSLALRMDTEVIAQLSLVPPGHTELLCSSSFGL